MWFKVEVFYWRIVYAIYRGGRYMGWERFTKWWCYSSGLAALCVAAQNGKRMERFKGAHHG